MGNWMNYHDPFGDQPTSVQAHPKTGPTSAAIDQSLRSPNETVRGITPNYRGLTNKNIFRGDITDPNTGRTLTTFSDTGSGATQKGYKAGWVSNAGDMIQRVGPGTANTRATPLPPVYNPTYVAVTPKVQAPAPSYGASGSTTSVGLNPRYSLSDTTMPTPMRSTPQRPVRWSDNFNDGWPSYKRGGAVTGGPPGVDQVPATMPDGSPARLNKGEYVLPAEVVDYFGGPAELDKLVKSITGKKPGAELKPALPVQ